MSRKPAEAETPENHERWIVSYADMVTLLWALFVVLYALSDSNPRKLLVVSESINRAFETGVMAGSTGSSPIFTTGGGITPSISGVKATDFDNISQQVNEVNQALGLSNAIQVRTDSDSITLSVSGDVLFATGRADLQPGSQLILDEIAALVAAMPNRVIVEGHTDSVPVNNPDFDDNWDLSAKRANNVLNYLVTHGVAAERLHSASYGETRPIGDNATIEGRALNRRADIVIVYPTQEELDRALIAAGQAANGTETETQTEESTP